MRYSIHQISATDWELRDEDGNVIATFHDGPGHNGYQAATAHLGTLLRDQLADAPAASAGGGLLPERWVDDAGIAFSRMLDGGRDFTNCAWSWRDPQACLVPLMFQTETDFGHMGAELAGFVEELTQASGTVHGAGRFYDSEIGTAARDVLLEGRRFGVSVDPSELVDATYHEECIETDADGFCTDYDFSIIFNAYEIAGVTMTPFPGFAEANIILDSTAAASTQPVRASVSVPTRPPRAWLSLTEPRPGVPFLDGMGDDVLVEQRDSNGDPAGFACPLTITDDGQVYGHLTFWGQCHVADPWGPGVCASASRSENGYADFLTGVTRCDDGTDVRTGVLTVGCEHSGYFTPGEVRDHMAHAGLGWASVNVVDGDLGPWLCGVLRPDLTDTQVQVLRRLSLSGEWVGELGGILAVNKAGLPVQRALAASAFGGRTIGTALRASAIRDGKVARLVGANIVRDCPECTKRKLSAGGDSSMAHVLRTLAVLERRTRHLQSAEIEATRARLHS